MRDFQHRMFAGAVLVLLASAFGCRHVTQRSIPFAALQPESSFEGHAASKRSASAIRRADRIESRLERLPQIEQFSSSESASTTGQTQTWRTGNQGRTDCQSVLRTCAPGEPKLPCEAVTVSYEQPADDATSATDRLREIIERSDEPEELEISQAERIVVPAIGPTVDSTTLPMDAFAVDLGNALALGGASHRQIQLARERVIEAQANWSRARFARLPSLRFGVGYNKHEGRIQETEGNILEVSRNSLFVGGGAGLGDFPLAGGSAGPSRLMVNLSLADAMFEPLTARQLADAASANEAATFNDSLLSIAVGYFDLVQSYAQLGNTQHGETAAEQMLQLARLFAKSGKGARAEVYRAEAELAYWSRVRLDAERETKARAAELARLLSLDPLVTLVPVEERIAPIEIVPPASSVDALVLTALASRPEMARHSSVMAAMDSRLRQELLRPWLPIVQAGVSAGSFGGGTGSNFDNQASRGDVDLLAIWELRNLGLGNAALRGQRASQLRQAQVEALATRDQIVAEVKTARADVESYRQQIDSTQAGVIASEESYRANLDLIRNAEGLPLEMIQAIRARYEAQNGYAQAISDHNRAQFRLLRSLGETPSA